jgi:streptogramin lyase
MMGNRARSSIRSVLAWPIILVAAACAAATPGATGSVSPSPPPSPAALETSMPKVKPTPKPRPVAIVGELDAGGAGWAMTKIGGALWIQVDPPVDAIVRIDVASEVAAPAVAGGIDAKSGPEGLWVVCCDGFARVDPATGKEMFRVPQDGAFALAEGSVWSLSEDRLQRLDPQSGKVVGKPVGPIAPSECQFKDMIVAFGSAWLACKEGKVVRIDASSGKVTSVTTQLGAHTFALTDAAVWVTNYQAGSVSRIDPATNLVTTIEGAGSGVGITSGGGYVWASTPRGIAKIDPATAAIVGTIDLGPGAYYELVWDDGIIWASTRGSRVLKIDASKAEP